MTNSNNIANIDLDNTVADYTKSLYSELELMQSPTDITLSQEAIDTLPYLKARKRAISNKVGFWENLEPIPLGMEVVDVIRKYFQLNILTRSPTHSNIAWSEKAIWVKKYIPDAAITITESPKGLTYGKVLFDDWPEYIIDWLNWRKRGLVLMLDHDYNRNFHHKNVIRISKDTNLKLVEQALKDRANNVWKPL